jgi:hypothetical protein
MYSDEYDVTLSVHPHRASSKFCLTMHGGNRTRDLWLARCGCRVIPQTSYSPEYITPTHTKSIIISIIRHIPSLHFYFTPYHVKQHHSLCHFSSLLQQQKKHQLPSLHEAPPDDGHTTEMRLGPNNLKSTIHTYTKLFVWW